MGCASCAARAALRKASRELRVEKKTVEELIAEGCSFTKENIADWEAKLLCFKAKGLYISTPNLALKTLNSYIGIVASAMNSDPCYFENQLDEIQQSIIMITTLGTC